MRIIMIQPILRISLLIAVTLVFPLINSAKAAPATPSLDWLSGHWCAEQDTNTIEELWLPPHGGVSVGLGRTLDSERTTGFEYFRIVDLDGVQSFVAQPGGNLPTTFRRTDGGENWIRFENPDHDFPQRIEYHRAGETLHAEVSGPGENGKELLIGFDYFSCGSQAQTNPDADSIRSARAESNQAIARHDVEAIVSSFDVEYVITISTGDILPGREPQAESWSQHFAEFSDVLYIRTPSGITISEAYPLAIENGTWVGTMTTENGAFEKGGQYTASWRKVNGAWKIYSELYVALYCNGVDCP
jgi:ketosteroid isomerase-like protein